MPPNGRGQSNGDPTAPHQHQWAGDVQTNTENQTLQAGGQTLPPLPPEDQQALRQAAKNQAAAQISQQQNQLAQQVGTRSAPAIGSNNYMSFSHDALYQMVNTDLSSDQVGQAGKSWNSIGNTLVNVSTTLSKASQSA